jgi:hypothetical protein
VTPGCAENGNRDRIGEIADNVLAASFLLVIWPRVSQPIKEAQRQGLAALLAAEPYEKVRSFMTTTYERGKIEGKIETALRLLEAKCGPVSSEVRKRVGAMSSEQLDQLLLDLLKSSSLRELRLTDDAPE